MCRPSMRWLLITLLAALSLAAGSARPGLAQAGGPAWSTPENISNLTINSAYPVVLADKTGRVHVFWTASGSGSSGQNNVIYYTRRSDAAWSQPVDVITSPQGLSAQADMPAAVIGPDNRFHLVFTGGFNGMLYYTSAPVEQAMNVRAWSTPLMIGESATGVVTPAITYDDQGVLHIAYAVQTTTRQGVYHLTSKDNGASWSLNQQVPGSRLGSGLLLWDLRMAIAPSGHIYLAWMWSTIEIFPPKGIYFARSLDGGQTWDRPVSFAEGPYRYPDLAVIKNEDGGEQVHLVWSGTSDDRFKFSRYSDDFGASWSQTVTMKSLGGFQGYAGLAVDSLGRLHLGMAATYYDMPVGDTRTRADALIHSVWNRGGWSQPEALLVNAIPENNLQYASIAISEGNIAHIVAMYPVYGQTAEDQANHKYLFQIYYVEGQLDAPHIEPADGPLNATVVVPTPTRAPAPTEPATPAPLDRGPQGSEVKTLTLAESMGMGAAAVLMILAVTALTRVMRR